MSALATAADVSNLLGRALTSDEQARVASLLELASAACRAEARQEFTSQTHEVVTRPVGGLVRLSQKPVASITSVHTINDNGSVGLGLAGWTFDGVDLVNVGDITGLVINGPEDWEPDSVKVTYVAGWPSIPDDVRLVCADMVRLALLGPQAPVVSETIGSYSYRLADNAVGGAVAMTDGHRHILRRYRSSGVRTIGFRP
jgi:hypothetical protein